MWTYLLATIVLDHPDTLWLLQTRRLRSERRKLHKLENATSVLVAPLGGMIAPSIPPQSPSIMWLHETKMEPQTWQTDTPQNYLAACTHSSQGVPVSMALTHNKERHGLVAAERPKAYKDEERRRNQISKLTLCFAIVRLHTNKLAIVSTVYIQ